MTQLKRPEARPYRLRNQIQHYAWGTRNGGAFIPRLLGIPVEPGLPYAELWMGAHPKAPSLVQYDGGWISLRALIAAYPLLKPGIGAGRNDMPGLSGTTGDRNPPSAPRWKIRMVDR